jgi:hypothetical protein
VLPCHLEYLCLSRLFLVIVVPLEDEDNDNSKSGSLHCNGECNDTEKLATWSGLSREDRNDPREQDPIDYPWAEHGKSNEGVVAGTNLRTERVEYWEELEGWY